MSYGPPPGQQPYYGQPKPQAEGATTAMVLGILGLVLCQVLAPFAWMQGNKALQRIRESGGTLDGEGTAKAGQIMGIIGTVLLCLGVLFVIVMIIISVISYNSV